MIKILACPNAKAQIVPMPISIKIFGIRVIGERLGFRDFAGSDAKK